MHIGNVFDDNDDDTCGTCVESELNKCIVVYTHNFE